MARDRNYRCRWFKFFRCARISPPRQRIGCANSIRDCSDGTVRVQINSRDQCSNPESVAHRDSNLPLRWHHVRISVSYLRDRAGGIRLAGGGRRCIDRNFRASRGVDGGAKSTARFQMGGGLEHLRHARSYRRSRHGALLPGASLTSTRSPLFRSSSGRRSASSLTFTHLEIWPRRIRPRLPLRDFRLRRKRAAARFESEITRLFPAYYVADWRRDFLRRRRRSILERPD
jgi:hypothetical protein